MPISDMPIFSMLRTRMQWHQDRQQLLAENVANADTPKFRPRDLAPPRFNDSAPHLRAVSLARTDPGHLAGGSGADSKFQADRKSGYEIRPAGNAVNLEDEMTKVANNQMDYQAAATLYAKSLGLLKVAIGKR